MGHVIHTWVFSSNHGDMTLFSRGADLSAVGLWYIMMIMYAHSQVRVGVVIILLSHSLVGIYRVVHEPCSISFLGINKYTKTREYVYFQSFEILLYNT